MITPAPVTKMVYEPNPDILTIVFGERWQVTIYHSDGSQTIETRRSLPTDRQEEIAGFYCKHRAGRFIYRPLVSKHPPTPRAEILTPKFEF